MRQAVHPFSSALIAIGIAAAIGAGCSSDPAPKAASSGARTSMVTVSSTKRAGTTTGTRPRHHAKGPHATTTSSSIPLLITPPYVAQTTIKPLKPIKSAVPGGCAATDTVLVQAVMTYAKANKPTVAVVVSDIKHATSDKAWARATVIAPSSDNQEGFVTVAQCVGSQWKLIDSGTSGVGCGTTIPPAVKSEIGYNC